MLNHVRQGTGEPLVLLHPLGAELVVWEPVLERLSAERDVIAVDLPGFGGSPPLTDGVRPTPQALAGAVAAFLSELGLDRAHVGGNSLGGWVALELAKAGRALSVGALCSAGFWRGPLGPRPGPDVRMLGRALLPVLPALARTEWGRRKLLSGSVAYPERVPAKAAARLVRAYVTSPGYEHANAAMRSAVVSGLQEIEVPVSLAWGELDRRVRAPHTPLPPGWRSFMLRGCGHIPTWDEPELVARVLFEASAGR